MFRKAIYISLFFLLLEINNSYCQDITGTWEGDLNNSEFLQLNIVQVQNNLCGYTWDYIYGNRRDFCKAFFSGYYDTRKKEWILTGTSFISSSGNHVLMRIRLKKHYEDGQMILEGYETDPDMPLGSLFSLMNRQSVSLKKVSNKPTQMLGNMRDCLKKEDPKKETPKKEIPKKDSVAVKGPDKRDRKPDNKPDTIKKVVIPVKPIPGKPIDTLKEVKTPVKPPIAIKDSSLLKQMAKRKNTEMSRLVVHEKEIRIEVFDNGIVDSDTVSVFYNGKLILSHKKLSEKAIVIPISLDERSAVHEIILFAENLGSIPPNTALIVVHAGDKRYELFASASLTENAVITFEYKPK